MSGHTLSGTDTEGDGKAVPENPNAKIVDPYLKQKRTVNWNQELIESQVGLVLGVGGVGSTVAMNLVRMGFRKVFLIDRDIVDDHNLNRQILYKKEHVGKPKVFCAAEALQAHNYRTELVPLHIDAVAQWQQVVQCARQSTCVFNGIDFGDYWDYAVSSLCRKLGIPHALGGTDPITGHAVFYDFFAERHGPCALCLAEPKHREVLARILPEHILDLPTLHGIIPKDDQYRKGGSVVWACGAGADIMVGMVIDHILHMETVTGRPTPTRIFFNMLSWELEKYTLEPLQTCEFCRQTQSGAFVPPADTAPAVNPLPK
ncbi:putative ThiF family protein [Paratrimastix pyriformis]|uniref:ThiF family protein n=1 Tax=Paratrimastix pyriformis TaxID=342808 RepID=A0ABQ8UKV1_9EUKA|nr:putative ThiF family protein [Paratrimastix pyriformis]